MEPDASQWCPVTGQGAMAQTETCEIPCEHQETTFYCEGGRTLEEVVHGNGGVFILGDTQKPAGYSSEQSVSADSALSRGGGLDNLQTRQSPEVPANLICSVKIELIVLVDSPKFRTKWETPLLHLSMLSNCI